MDTLLNNSIRSHQEAQEHLDALVAGLTGTQFNWKPAPEVWSVGECLDHLNEALGTYIEKMAPAIEKARAEGKVGSEPYGRGTLVGRLLVGFLSREGKTARAPGVFRPASGSLDRDRVVQTFRERAARLIELAEEAEGLDLGRIRIATPVSPLLRLSLAQAFELHALHTPRHLAQAERVKHLEQFPSR